MMGLSFGSLTSQPSASGTLQGWIWMEPALLAGFDSFSQLESFCIHPAPFLKSAQSGSFEFSICIAVSVRPNNNSTMYILPM